MQLDHMDNRGLTKTRYKTPVFSLNGDRALNKLGKRAPSVINQHQPPDLSQAHSQQKELLSLKRLCIRL